MTFLGSHGDDVDGVDKFQPMGTLLSYAFFQSELSSSYGSVESTVRIEHSLSRHQMQWIGQKLLPFSGQVSHM